MGVALPSTPDTSFLIRTDKLLSNVNHRLYRQSRVYNVKIDIDADLADGGYVDVFALADTWYNHKAYNFAKSIFDENSAEELKQLGSSRARWNDFRVDDGAGTDAELQALQYGAGVVSTRFTGGEYFISEISNAAGNSNTMRWTGTGTGTWNIIDQYDLTGNTDASPSTASAVVAYDGITDELDDSQMEHLSEEGNLPPYDSNALENSCWMLVARLYVDAAGTSKFTTGYFDAPCGLVRLATGSGLEANNITGKICISVKNGDYKGVHAPSYLE